MKRFLSILMVFSALTIAAVAADRASGSISLASTVKVGSTELPAGSYKVTWTGTGDSAQVTLKQGKYSVTAPAQVVDAKRAQNAYSTKDENGARVLTEIQFQEKTLLFRDQATPITGQ